LLEHVAPLGQFSVGGDDPRGDGRRPAEMHERSCDSAFGASCGGRRRVGDDFDRDGWADGSQEQVPRRDVQHADDVFVASEQAPQLAQLQRAPPAPALHLDFDTPQGCRGHCSHPVLRGRVRRRPAAAITSRSTAAARRAIANPDALLSRTDLRELGLERRAVDAVFRSCPVIVLPGYRRPLVRVADYLGLLEQSTYDGDRVR
jgi:hypothetical protein